MTLSDVALSVMDASFHLRRTIKVQVGEQVPLLIGPCLYCHEGYVPHLPAVCPTCGALLTKLVYPPKWASGRLYKVWWLWMFFKFELRERLDHVLHTTVLIASRGGA